MLPLLTKALLCVSLFSTFASNWLVKEICTGLAQNGKGGGSRFQSKAGASNKYRQARSRGRLRRCASGLFWGLHASLRAFQSHRPPGLGFLCVVLCPPRPHFLVPWVHARPRQRLPGRAKPQHFPCMSIEPVGYEHDPFSE